MMIFETVTTGESEERFKTAFELAYRGTQGVLEFTHYSIGELGLLLVMGRYKAELVGYQLLPYNMDLSAASSFAWHWLRVGPFLERKPQGDGDSHKGWRISVSRNPDTVVVKPEWIYYGK